MSAKRICLVGSQGTGKSTVLNIFKERNYPVITEVVRNLVKTQGITINRDGDDAGQRLIFDTYEKLLGVDKPYVSDRGLFDVCAYTIDSCGQGKVSKELEEELIGRLREFIKANEDIVYVYFPIEFPVVADGVRSTDENYRKMIDSLIYELLFRYAPAHQVMVVSGTPEERYNQIMDFVGPDTIA